MLEISGDEALSASRLSLVVLLSGQPGSASVRSSQAPGPRELSLLSGKHVGKVGP